MIQKILPSTQSYNTYSSNKAKNRTALVKSYNSQLISFKSSNNLIKKKNVIGPVLTFFAGIGTLFGIKKNKTDFDKYFKQISKKPAEIFVNGELVQNPELTPYADMLDKLSRKEKKQFVEAFCQKTGFPDLDEVQKRMDNEIKRAIYAETGKTTAKPIFAAYMSCCSSAKGYAVPGSDCDGLFIIVDKPFNKQILNRATIGNEINQRLLDTQGIHYPELFTLDELMPYIKLSNKIFDNIKTDQKLKNYILNIKRNDQDFMKAGEFNIDIASQIRNREIKDMVYLTAMFVEELRAGHILINDIDPEKLEIIKDSALYKYSNVVRQEGFKDNIKPKWANRKKLSLEFNRKTNEEQFEICSEILKSSMGIHKAKPSDCYEEFDMGNNLELINALTSFGHFFEK